ncbi:class I adenylate-forming enzyme family protein [Rhodococcus sp. NPDC059968]|uniref:class I adenylate-forming enzyme family protein n=1 Tax=Rhodococcus sp. NPDC059968 TaxID=3347017 RepID=UPI00366FFA86
MNLVWDVFERGLRRNPGNPLFVLDDGTYSYAEFGAAVDRFCWALAGLGVTKGDRVSYYMSNRFEALVTYWACIKMGAVLVPLNVMLRPREVVHVLNDAGTKVLVADMGVPNVRASLESSVPELRTVEAIVPCRGTVPGYRSWEAVLEAGRGDPFSVVDCAEDDVAQCFYTSGTEGRMKGAVTSYGSLFDITQNYVLSFGFRRTDVAVTSMPIYAAFSPWFILQPIMQVGGTVILHETFDAKRILGDIERYHANYFCGSPTMFVSLLAEHQSDAADFDVSSLRTCGVSGAKMPEDLIAAFEAELGCRIGEVYGQTETGPVAVTPVYGQRRAGAAGLPAGGTTIRILNEQDEALPHGEVGEIVVQSSMCTRGYLNLPDLSEELWRSGWLHTGDLGYLDEDQFLYVVDRKKDVIITGGANIYPAEVEQVLMEHPGILHAAVVGVPDYKYGELPRAYVVRGANTVLDDSDVISFCRERLAKYKAPRSVVFLEEAELPMTANRKILRRELRDLARAEAAIDA